MPVSLGNACFAVSIKLKSGGLNQRFPSGFYPVMEEIIEGFVEGSLTELEHATLTLWRVEAVETTWIIRPIWIAEIR
jgi:hypothetical protein